MPGPLYVDVVLPIPVEQAFTYSVPSPLQHRAQTGMRALVPVKQRREMGYVVAVRDSVEIDGVKAVVDLPDPEPVFTRELLELCKWIGEYYCCSWGEALHCALPAGLVIKSKVRYVLNPNQICEGRFTDRQRKIIALLYQRGPLTEGQLAKAMGRGSLSNTLHSLVARDVLRAEPMVPRQSASFHTESYVHLIESAIPDAASLEQLQRRAPRQAAVYLDLLNNQPERMASELYEKHQATSTTVRALCDRGLLRVEDREVYRVPDIAVDGGSALKHTLNANQQAAHDAIVAAVHDKKFQTFLLKGVTGSGKTEVYLQVIEAVLAEGRDAIMLVPEISLTPQTVGRFKARFQTEIAVLHSGLGAGERYDEWRRAHRGEVRIVVGARSAIFAPVRNLGIIIVDEEHDNSYKQGETPRYHARDVAVMRAMMNDAVCVLGSATPSIESYHNTRAGKSVCLVLPGRATQGVLPEVTVIDMRDETREIGANAFLSRRLESAVRDCVSGGGQALLLLNRRGFAPFVLCPSCGWLAECPDCNVSMTYHQKGAYLRCHYCNRQRSVPPVCDQCHFNPLLFMGAGTQRVEDVLQRTFEQFRIARMDADTTSGKGGHAKILGRLANGDIDILVGTQMIAKGHDYPGVTLVGVINADMGLGIPDFRAAETTFQLLTQVAGRAGRGNRPGQVIVQTYRPRHYAIQAAAEHDYDGFFDKEIAQREAAQYPPFRRMGHLLIEAEDPREAERGAMLVHRVVREEIDRLGYKGMEILGPAPASVSRVMKKYRWNIGLLSKSGRRVNQLVRAARAVLSQGSGLGKVQVKVDLDPYGAY
ncbi:MAG: primosomal protein N' [Candidatus Hydrogenedentota bacterium]